MTVVFAYFCNRPYSVGHAPFHYFKIAIVYQFYEIVTLR